MRRLILLLFAGCCCMQMAAAQSANDSTFRELALQALTYPGAPPNEVELFPGALPDSFTVPFDLPGGARLIGSMRRPYETTIFVEASLSAEEVARFYYDHFRQAGWKTQVWPRWGFATAAEAYPNLYCSPTESKWLNVMPTSLPGKPTDVRITINGVAGERTPCENEGMVERPGDLPPMPLLTLPSDARMTSTGSGSGMFGMEEVQASVTFLSEQTMDELVQHFASQLEQAGWKQINHGEGEPAIWRTYTVQDEQGRTWNGQLVLTQLPGQDRVSAFVLASKVS